MKRLLALRILLVLVGLLFVAAIFPLTTFVRRELQPHAENAIPMMLSLYFTLGVFLLIATRDPAVHRSIIAFAAWSSLAHAAVMVVMAGQLPSERGEVLAASAGLSVIGLLLIALAPRRDSPRRIALPPARPASPGR